MVSRFVFVPQSYNKKKTQKPLFMQLASTKAPSSAAQKFAEMVGKIAEHVTLFAWCCVFSLAFSFGFRVNCVDDVGQCHDIQVQGKGSRGSS